MEITELPLNEFEYNVLLVFPTIIEYEDFFKEKINLDNTLNGEFTGEILAYQQEDNGITFRIQPIICGTGKINAAIRTISNLQKFRYDLACLMGYAGSMGRYKVGDCCMGIEFEEYDIDYRPIVSFKNNYTRQDPLSESPNRYSGRCSSDFSKQLVHSLVRDDSLLINIVRIGTGDSFISNARQVDASVDIIDMESAAFAKSCIYTGVPFVVFRIISDMCDSKSSDVFVDGRPDGLPEKFRSDGSEFLKKIFPVFKEFKE